MSSPHYHASAMDGIAVKAEDTFPAHEQNPVQLKLNEGFVYVNTGNEIPAPYNAVIMIEHVDELDEETIEIIEPASLGSISVRSEKTLFKKKCSFHKVTKFVR